MHRILVIGPCGAGKSFVSERLGEALNLPVIHLDAEYFLPGWVEPDPVSWERRLADLISRPSWVIDGSHLATLAQRLRRANSVVLLDIPTWVCFLRVIGRVATQYGRVRPDMAAGCPEQLDVAFLKFVLQYRRDQLPRVLAQLKRFEGSVLRLRTTPEVNRFLASPSAWLSATQDALHESNSNSTVVERAFDP
jgi:adenylate kinase family enzyme